MKYFESNDQLQNLIDNHPKTVLYFSASWCSPCKTLSPIMEEASAEFAGRINIVKVDIDKAQDVAQQHGVRSVPTLMFLDNGKVVDSAVGAKPKNQIKQWLSAQL